MHTRTMEGLTGASMNMKMLNTPLCVYKEAKQRGDTAVMERAMGYVGEFAKKAEDYQKKAEKGMKEDAKEAKEKAEAEQENAIQKRKEERKEQEKRIEESRNAKTDTVNISENGKAALGGKPDTTQAGTDHSVSEIDTVDAVKLEPVIYTNSGETAKPEQGASLSVSV